MSTDANEALTSTVREHYARVAREGAGVGCAPGCCGASPDASRALGYGAEDLAAVPEGANLGLGCGNPQAIAALREGETVLDLGCGGGLDCFLAARQVGPTGRVIGVDMTAEMVERARRNAREVGATNVEFRLGEIEHLPVADRSVDAILSNCVVNLSPDKPKVFREAFRVLAPGGRLAISDVVAIAELPERLRADVNAFASCIAGAASPSDIRAMLSDAGFSDVRVRVIEESREMIGGWAPGSGAERYIASATIEAVKPSAACCGPSCCDGGATG